jgi:hypothetical protein
MHNAVSILTPKRDRPSLHSFSIRDLFLVTVIVALAAGWWVDRRSSQLTIQAKDSEITKAKRDLNIEKLQHTARFRWGNDYQLPTSSAPARNPPKP